MLRPGCVAAGTLGGTRQSTRVHLASTASHALDALKVALPYVHAVTPPWRQTAPGPRGHMVTSAPSRVDGASPDAGTHAETRRRTGLTDGTGGEPRPLALPAKSGDGRRWVRATRSCTWTVVGVPAASSSTTHRSSADDRCESPAMRPDSSRRAEAASSAHRGSALAATSRPVRRPRAPRAVAALCLRAVGGGSVPTRPARAPGWRPWHAAVPRMATAGPPRRHDRGVAAAGRVTVTSSPPPGCATR